MSVASEQSHIKIKKVDDYAHLILKKNLERISSITVLASTNEENPEVLALVDFWSRCLCIEDFLYGTETLDNGFRNRPVFSLEDFVVIFNASTGFVDQKNLQKLCRKFADSFTTEICSFFSFLRGDTRHTDVLTAYLSAVLTVQLFILHHSEQPAFMYAMTAKAWTRYGVESEYSADVVQMNSYDITPAGVVEDGAGNIDLVSQRKKVCRN